MTYAVQMVRSGRTYDVEDSRATSRIHKTLDLLAMLDAAPVRTHGTRTYWDSATNRDKHHCALDGSGYRDCTVTFPEWLTDEMINEAWSLADRFLTKRGDYNRAAAYALMEAR